MRSSDRFSLTTTQTNPSFLRKYWFLLTLIVISILCFVPLAVLFGVYSKIGKGVPSWPFFIGAGLSATCCFYAGSTLCICGIRDIAEKRRHAAEKEELDKLIPSKETQQKAEEYYKQNSSTESTPKTTPLKTPPPVKIISIGAPDPESSSKKEAPVKTSEDTSKDKAPHTSGKTEEKTSPRRALFIETAGTSPKSPPKNDIVITSDPSVIQDSTGSSLKFGGGGGQV